MDTATWGVVFIDPLTGTRTAEGGTVPQFLVKQWHALGSEQVITLAEAFAALLARHMFVIALNNDKSCSSLTMRELDTV